MFVRFWGTRGSIAKPGPDTVRYGGNTSCVEIGTAAGTTIVVDIGTGAHGLGVDLLSRGGGGPVDGHVFISHTHWDHIQGLPFFAPLFGPDNTWHIYGPSGAGSSLGEILAGQMEYRYFPVALHQLASTVDYHDLVEGQMVLGDDVTVTTRYLNHPALTLGYRFDAADGSVVYSSDHEPHDPDLAPGGDVADNRQDDAHAAFAAGCDLLIHDAQYLADEYPARQGWGHSTIEYVLEVARSAECGAVALYHHDPGRTDAQVDDLLAAARERAATIGYRGTVLAAAEGQLVDVTPPSPRTRPRPTQASAIDQEEAASATGSVLVAAPGGEITTTVHEAATGEGFGVVLEPDLRRAFEVASAAEPSIVLIEAVDDDGSFDLIAAIRGLGTPWSRDVPIIMVGGTAARWRPDAGEAGITEWLAWPCKGGYVRAKLRAWHVRRALRWQAAGPVPDEDRRLASLHALGVLDTPPEERFDELTRTIAERLGVPIALVSLVDQDRQWFKSRLGVDVDETSRDVSLCAHAIHGPHVLHVPDALDDDRFADNPMVAGGPRLRFYAGAPLQLSDGTAAGTLCVLDTRPRRLDDGQLAELERVARRVVEELERR